MAWLDSLDTTTPSRSLQIGCALSYALSSIGIMFINKIVLTSYGFPSFQFLAVCQFIATIVCLQILKMCNVLSFPSASLSTIRALMPLPIIFLLNCVSGLGGTKHLSLPMFTVLRRFSIVMILFMEAYILHKPASQRTKLSVFLLIAGSLVAAWADVGFNLTGYSLVLFNDFTTALYGVYMKKKLESKELGTFGLLFYNSAVSILPATAIMMVVQPDAIGKSLDFPLWNDPLFASLFLCATLLGCALNIATVLCTKTTSALTTAMVGSLKNTLTTYVGMFAGGDYIFNPTNFAGLTISVSGSLYYTFVKYDEMKTANKQLPTPATASEK